MGLASLILGIFACLFALLPVFGPLITVPLAGIALPLSITVLKRNRKRQKRGERGVALAGLIFAVSSLPIMVIRTVSLW